MAERIVSYSSIHLQRQIKKLSAWPIAQNREFNHKNKDLIYTPNDAWTFAQSKTVTKL
jgi:hypothetical protein